MKKAILGIVLVALIAGGGYAVYQWNKPHRSVASEEAIRIGADMLFEAYSKDEKAANARFLNQPLEVNGAIAEVQNNQEGQQVIILQTTDEMFGIKCTMLKPAPGLAQGQTLTIKGFCSGYVSDVVLDNCIIKSQS